jgi:hypothetical protein
MSDALREFLGDDSINFYGAAVGNDVKMLKYYGIASISGMRDLQRMIPNPGTNYSPSPYAKSNHSIGRKLVKKVHNSIRCDNWSEVSLCFDHIMYASLDAHLFFKVAMTHWHLRGYNSIRDQLNV